MPLADPPEPLGFSGELGCTITLIVLLPILILIVTLVATITIITCLNLGGCFEQLFQNMMEGFLEGLTHP
jgi:hypothetical protein